MKTTKPELMVTYEEWAQRALIAKPDCIKKALPGKAARCIPLRRDTDCKKCWSMFDEVQRG